MEKFEAEKEIKKEEDVSLSSQMEKQQDVTSENVETEVQSENLKKGLFSTP